MYACWCRSAATIGNRRGTVSPPSRLAGMTVAPATYTVSRSNPIPRAFRWRSRISPQKIQGQAASPRSRSSLIFASNAHRFALGPDRHPAKVSRVPFRWRKSMFQRADNSDAQSVQLRRGGCYHCAPRRRPLSLEGDSVHQAAVVPGGVQATIELQRARLADVALEDLGVVAPRFNCLHHPPVVEAKARTELSGAAEQTLDGWHVAGFCHFVRIGCGY